MDKKDIVIGVSCIAFIALAREYKNLVSDFRTAQKMIEQRDDLIQAIERTVTDAVLADLEERLNED